METVLRSDIREFGEPSVRLNIPGPVKERRNFGPGIRDMAPYKKIRRDNVLVGRITLMHRKPQYEETPS